MTDISIFNYIDATHFFSAGEAVFRVGDKPDVMYYVKSGSLVIMLDDTKIADVEPGSIVGEMAMIDSEPRSATVTAVTDCSLIAIDEEGFLKHINGTPHFLIFVMRIAVDRLRKYLHKDL